MGLLIGSNAVKSLYIGDTSVRMVYLGGTKVWPIGLPAGTVYNFEYTGQVQSVELPPGRYLLECWGAQGGNTSSYDGEGSHGGYAKGVLTLTETTTLHVFVGGQGGSSGNGGWNGGGSSTGYSYYSLDQEYGESWPACGGGATDIALVSSDMSYSSGRTNRSSASLLSRIIVAGGGAGASARYTEVTTTDTEWVEVGMYTGEFWWWSGDDGMGNLTTHVYAELPVGTYRVYVQQHASLEVEDSFSGTISVYSDDNQYYAELNEGDTFIINSEKQYSINVRYTLSYPTLPSEPASDTIVLIERQESTTASDTSFDYTTGGGEGGGTSGNGSYPGTRSSAGGEGGFGYGANQETTNYMYCGGAGGGGWYGGGTSRADSTTDVIYDGSGGSGFVNTAANSSYRPSGYTGLQLDSGSTTAGQNLGDGYAKITVLGDGDSGDGEDSGNASIRWSTRTGTWNESSKSAAADGKSFTCVSPGDSGSTVIRCTFSGVTSITFNCVYSGESNYDYLTVGNIDSSCTRDSYGTTLKGTSGTSKDITFTCDTGMHYVEFCYSKDSSVSTSPDNATVYCKTYS